MSDRRRLVEEEARELREEYGDAACITHSDRFDCGFLDGRTVTSKQLEAMERAVDRHNGNLFNPEELIADALDAAGLLIEGDDDD